MSAGSDDMVDDTTITFKQIHEAIYPSSKSATEQSVGEIPGSSADTKQNDNEEYSGSNFVSLSELSQKPSTLSTGGISFLNESEIEGTAMPESVAGPSTTSTEAAPGQTAAGDDGNRAAEDLTWANMETSRTNWADEDVVVAESAATPAAVETIAPPPEVAPTKGGLQPLSDFKTIEKKSQNRGDAGRGRVSLVLQLCRMHYIDICRDAVPAVEDEAEIAVEVVVASQRRKMRRDFLLSEFSKAFRTSISTPSLCIVRHVDTMPPILERFLPPASKLRSCPFMSDCQTIVHLPRQRQSRRLFVLERHLRLMSTSHHQANSSWSLCRMVHEWHLLHLAR